MFMTGSTVPRHQPLSSYNTSCSSPQPNSNCRTSRSSTSIWHHNGTNSMAPCWQAMPLLHKLQRSPFNHSMHTLTLDKEQNASCTFSLTNRTNPRLITISQRSSASTYNQSRLTPFAQPGAHLAFQHYCGTALSLFLPPNSPTCTSSLLSVTCANARRCMHAHLSRTCTSTHIRMLGRVLRSKLHTHNWTGRGHGHDFRVRN